MAIIKQGILGGIQNKIGNVVGTSWKGIAVLKSMPISVANPRTAPQVAQRSRFANTVAFATAILAEVIKPLWDRFAQRKSGYNSFVQTNIIYFSDEGLDIPSGLVISKGQMTATPLLSVTANSTSGQLTVTWPNDAGEGFKQGNDTAFIVVAGPKGNNAQGFDTGVLRSSQTATVSADLTSGTTYSVWLAFRRADGTVVSDTSYATVVAS